MNPRDLLTLIPSDNGRLGTIAARAYGNHKDVFTFEEVAVVSSVVYAMVGEQEAEYIDKVISFSHEAEIGIIESLQYHYDTEMKVQGHELRLNHQAELSGYLKKSYWLLRASWGLLILLFIVAPVLYAVEWLETLFIYSIATLVSYYVVGERTKDGKEGLTRLSERLDYRVEMEKIFPEIQW